MSEHLCALLRNREVPVVEYFWNEAVKHVEEEWYNADGLLFRYPKRWKAFFESRGIFPLRIEGPEFDALARLWFSLSKIDGFLVKSRHSVSVFYTEKEAWQELWLFDIWVNGQTNPTYF